MRFSIITLFGELIQPFCETALIRRAIERKIIEVDLINLRDFGVGKHRRVDDYPYGTSKGMILMAEPLKNAIKSIKHRNKYVVYTSPAGVPLNQRIIEDNLSRQKHIVIVAGRYKSIDQRFIDKHVDLEVSIGDYVLQGGEIPAVILLESVSRFVSGFLGDIDSAESDSFSKGFLDCPRYTRPYEFDKMKVPKILLSGNHKKIEEFEEEESLKLTFKRRRDLLDTLDLTKRQKEIIYRLTLEEKDGKVKH
ncbi:TPA: tRNA (guanosine(37)-N1)-methyltransferase TrmD [candidate division WOR-3 bacterium]|jgi:tRNA (guanine37-N1)-methyltransferase|uniref:tRNA (guanine-N(1)-)-methyltransferase n=1 Tax=candidate division WOR-3 bacterium TaxID=2052148 RepID=A0A350HAW1_UNCW3|nr:tRNA (guanosine(37)-N1)-methyltransferase TrmD [candidate division WOR-3 bacterium]